MPSPSSPSSPPSPRRPLAVPRARVVHIAPVRTLPNQRLHPPSCVLLLPVGLVAHAAASRLRQLATAFSLRRAAARAPLMAASRRARSRCRAFLLRFFVAFRSRRSSSSQANVTAVLGRAAPYLNREGAGAAGRVGGAARACPSNAGRHEPRGSSSGSRTLANARNITPNAGPASLRGDRGETKPVRGQMRKRSQRPSCAERLTSVSAPGSKPSRRRRERLTKPGETVTKLVDDPGGKADGGEAEANLGRRADGAGGVAVARLGRTPCCA